METTCLLGRSRTGTIFRSTSEWPKAFEVNSQNHERLDEAKRNGATFVMTHTTPAGEAARLAEEQDLIAYWHPVLNTHHRSKLG